MSAGREQGEPNGSKGAAFRIPELTTPETISPGKQESLSREELTVVQVHERSHGLRAPAHSSRFSDSGKESSSDPSSYSEPASSSHLDSAVVSRGDSTDSEHKSADIQEELKLAGRPAPERTDVPKQHEDEVKVGPFLDMAEGSCAVNVEPPCMDELVIPVGGSADSGNRYPDVQKELNMPVPPASKRADVPKQHEDEVKVGPFLEMADGSFAVDVEPSSMDEGVIPAGGSFDSGNRPVNIREELSLAVRARQTSERTEVPKQHEGEVEVGPYVEMTEGPCAVHIEPHQVRFFSKTLLEAPPAAQVDDIEVAPEPDPIPEQSAGQPPEDQPPEDRRPPGDAETVDRSLVPFVSTDLAEINRMLRGRFLWLQLIIDSLLRMQAECHPPKCEFYLVILLIVSWYAFMTYSLAMRIEGVVLIVVLSAVGLSAFLIAGAILYIFSPVDIFLCF